ncbi:MAG: glycosyltransferase family 4 protein [Sphaerochaetaceae bacterium]|jgi:glycosyltransferase involved in cell wall biosynthesis
MTGHAVTGKRIGIIHFKTGDTDGVSLEIDKWTHVFQQAGHIVFLCSGRHGRNQQSDTTDENTAAVTIIDELDYHTEEAMRMNRETFDSVSDEASYHHELLRQADRLQGKLEAWIRDNRLDVVIPQNIWSVGLHPAAAIALARAVEHTAVRVLAQHHDFYWERTKDIRLSCPMAIEFADTYLPPHNPSYVHVVINSLAKEALAKRKGIDAAVIPNVLDFAGPEWEIDAWNADFRTAFDLAPSDIIVLQATRVIPRKGIELAIDIVAALQRRKESLIGKTLSTGKVFSASNRIVLVLAGYAQDDDTGTYLKRLEQKADMESITMLSIGDRITATRANRGSNKTYTLWDAYAHADLVTYPSYWEGWGNQLLEAVKARVPIVLFEYPVYTKDIASSGFSVISLGKTIDSWSEHDLAQIKDETIQEAADLALVVLLDRQKKKNMVESNYRIARQYYSLESLASYLEPMMSDWS